VPQVVFPANLDCCVLAVSMVELFGQGYRLMARPGTVAYGRSVDFVSASTIGGIPAAGLTGTTYVDEVAKFSWSSAATATYAGLISLAWQYAKSQGWNREQLLSVLRKCSSSAEITDFSGESVEAVAGAGILDAYCATGGAQRAFISGPVEVQAGKRVVLQARTNDGRPPGVQPPPHLAFSWAVNGTPAGGGSSSLVLDTTRVGQQNITLAVRDALDKSTLRATSVIKVTPPSDQELIAIRELQWINYVADWATFLNGGRHDRKVNEGKMMPQGCQIRRVLGLLVTEGGATEADQTPRPSYDAGSHGFSISRLPDIDPNDLGVLIHQWHDGFSAVRTRPVYEVYQPRGVDCLVPGLLVER
jgi:hypothetical protein